MENRNESADSSATASDSASRIGTPPPLPMRAGALPVVELIDLYMGHYGGRDTTRVQRLAWWKVRLAGKVLQDTSDDDIHAGLEALTQQANRFYAGKDADGRPVYKARRKPLSPATLNRYVAAIGAVFSWAVKRRIAPKGWVHPCRSVERRAEHNEKTRFLSADERTRVLEACKASSWPRLYLLVLLAITTGARKGELLGLRWCDVDLVGAVALVGRTKNGDPKVLPLVPAVIEELKRFAGKPAALVFPSTRTPERACTYEPRWQEALRVAKVKGATFHTLRHTCASVLAQNGATLLEIADLLGHRQLQVTKRYSHLAVQHKSALVNRVLGNIK